MKIYIASDHGGFETKKNVLSSLENSEHELEDLGPFELNPDDDYPDYAEKVAKAVAGAGLDDALEAQAFGILICRSGNGMVVAANKVRGAYAALCFTSEHARKAREDDNANILCLDSDYKGEDIIDIVQAFLNASFEGEDTRHGRRFKKILEIEGRN